MRTADSSVLVAALVTWHEYHEVALTAVERLDCLVAHTLAETFAALTAIRAPYRSPVNRLNLPLNLPRRRSPSELVRVQSVQD